MAIKFLENYDKETQHIDFESSRQMHDRRSYCANSDLFYYQMEPIATRRLSAEECKRQAECYRS